MTTAGHTSSPTAELAPCLGSILSSIDRWPAPHAAACVVLDTGEGPQLLASRGDLTRPFPLASITKMLTAYAVLIAVEEGIVTLDEPVTIAPAGVTLRHLLAHAAGYRFAGVEPIAGVGQRRVYSNTGIEVAAKWVEQAAAMAFAAYLTEAVLEPLHMNGATLQGSPAHGLTASCHDLAAFASELLTPRLLDASTLAEMTRTQYPELAGIVPGMGQFTPCPWGLGVEIAGHKAPHWMGRSRSEHTFGHFGGAGTMMWVDPRARVSLIALTDHSFDQWAALATSEWARLSDAVVDAVALP